MELVQIYVNRRPIGRVLMQDDLLEPTVTLRASRPPPPSRRPACEHGRRTQAFAFRRSRDEHWPISYCEDCLTVLAGRDPLARWRRRRKLREPDLAAAQWSRAWPKRGRPRADRPPRSVAWPEAA